MKEFLLSNQQEFFLFSSDYENLSPFCTVCDEDPNLGHSMLLLWIGFVCTGLKGGLGLELKP